MDTENKQDAQELNEQELEQASGGVSIPGSGAWTCPCGSTQYHVFSNFAPHRSLAYAFYAKCDICGHEQVGIRR